LLHLAFLATKPSHVGVMWTDEPTSCTVLRSKVGGTFLVGGRPPGLDIYRGVDRLGT
jgi:hypothetical protein